MYKVCPDRGLEIDVSEDSSDTTACSLCVSAATLDERFKDEINRVSGENVLSCYQCGECTAGCPVAYCMDVAPNQIMRMTQLGMEDDVLNCASIWLCAGCEMCATRCPRGVALSRVMDACRHIATEKGVKPKEANVLKFHEEFLKEIQRNGRIHEISLIALYKLRSKQFFADVFQGMQMFLKGKLAPMPHRVKNRKEVQGLFKK